MKTFMKRHQILQYANWIDGMPFKEFEYTSSGKPKEKMPNYSSMLMINTKAKFLSIKVTMSFVVHRLQFTVQSTALEVAVF